MQIIDPSKLLTLCEVEAYQYPPLEGNVTSNTPSRSIPLDLTLINDGQKMTCATMGGQPWSLDVTLHLGKVSSPINQIIFSVHTAGVRFEWKR